MKNLIGNSFKVFLKETDKSIDGLLINIDEKYDYIQREKSICIIPKQNVLYYETDKMSQSSKLIDTSEVQDKTSDKILTVYVDDAALAEFKVPESLEATDLINFIYSNKIVQNALNGKIQKSIECFDDSVYILTNQKKEKDIVDSDVSFSEISNPINNYLNPADMASRLNNAIVKRK